MNQPIIQNMNDNHGDFRDDQGKFNDKKNQAYAVTLPHLLRKLGKMVLLVPLGTICR